MLYKYLIGFCVCANSSSKRSFGKKRVEDSSSSSAKPRGFASKNRRTNSGFKKITN